MPYFVFLFPFSSDILGGRGLGDVCLFNRADLTHIGFSLQESQLLLLCLSEPEYDHFVFLFFFPHSGSQEIDGPHFPAKRVGGRFYDSKIELLLFVIFFTTFGLVRWPASSSQDADT